MKPEAQFRVVISGFVQEKAGGRGHPEIHRTSSVFVWLYSVDQESGRTAFNLNGLENCPFSFLSYENMAKTRNSSVANQHTQNALLWRRHF